MIPDLLFGLIGGLGFFFFGMQTMSDGLKKIAGDRLKLFLHTVTKHRVFGILIGAFVTLLIQSSSATTVMVVGFVNAGLLALKQAITVIMGANIGTTFTAWLVSAMSIFKITKYALPVVGIGFALMSFAKTKGKKNLGKVLLGFGLLFIGLDYMKDAFHPLKDSQMIKDIFVSFSNHPILGVLAGIIFTVLLQSSSATIAIVQVLAFNGVITFESAIPIILGDNIGTTITAQMAAVGTNLNARRAAMSHTLFNVIGVTYMLVFVQLGWFSQFIQWIIPSELSTETIMFFIAVSHSSFNVLNTIIFIPFVNVLERVTIWLVPQKEGSIDFGTKYLEPHLLDSPSLALEQVHKENAYMVGVAGKAVRQAERSFFERDLSRTDKVSELEDVTDNLQSEITQYLVQLSQRNLSDEESNELPVLIHNVNDIERIGDHAQNMGQLIKRAIEEKMSFSEQAKNELHMMWEEIFAMLQDAENALNNNEMSLAQKMLEREGKIDQLQKQFKEEHIRRLNDGMCDINAGFIFLEIIDNLEKIGDRLTNIAQSVLNKMQWQGEKKSSMAKND
jgi:phosphate:Na+ symporter